MFIFYILFPWSHLFVRCSYLNLLDTLIPHEMVSPNSSQTFCKSLSWGGGAKLGGHSFLSYDHLWLGRFAPTKLRSSLYSLLSSCSKMNLDSKLSSFLKRIFPIKRKIYSLKVFGGIAGFIAILEGKGFTLPQCSSSSVLPQDSLHIALATLFWGSPSH